MIKLKWIVGIMLLVILGGCAGQGTLTPEASLTASPRPSVTVSPEPPTVTATLEPTEEVGIFAGYYSTSFEVSSFVPCTSDETPGYGVGFWLETEPDSGFYELYNKVIAENFPLVTPAAPDAEQPVLFTRFQGRLSLPAENAQMEYNGYGHEGQYVRQITVTEVIEIVPADHQCDSP